MTCRTDVLPSTGPNRQIVLLAQSSIHIRFRSLLIPDRQPDLITKIKMTVLVVYLAQRIPRER